MWERPLFLYWSLSFHWYIYNDTSSNYFCSTCNEHYQFAQNHSNHNTITLLKKIYKNEKRQSRKKKCIFVFIGEAKIDCNFRNNKANKWNRICIRKNISIQKDIYFCIDTLIKGYESNKSNYYLTTNLLNNIHFNNIDFDSVIKSKYSFISAVNSFSIIEQNLTESSFKK